MADLEWAEDEFEADGVTPTKVEPGAGVKAKGQDSATANVSNAELNWMLHELGRLQPPLVESYTSNDTWTKDSQAIWIRAVVISDGGDGGDGNDAANGGGGGGGSRGGIIVRDGPASEFPASAAVTVGATSSLVGSGLSLTSPAANDGTDGGVSSAGSGGTAPTVDDLNGGAGGDGNYSGGSAVAGDDGWLAVGGAAGAEPGGGTASGGGGAGLGYGAGGGGGGGGDYSTGGGGGGGGASGYGTQALATAGEDGTGSTGVTAGGTAAPGIIVIKTWRSGAP
jgi:hypothetical protein